MPVLLILCFTVFKNHLFILSLSYSVKIAVECSYVLRGLMRWFLLGLLHVHFQVVSVTFICGLLVQESMYVAALFVTKYLWWKKALEFIFFLVLTYGQVIIVFNAFSLFFHHFFYIERFFFLIFIFAIASMMNRDRFWWISFKLVIICVILKRGAFIFWYYNFFLINLFFQMILFIIIFILILLENRTNLLDLINWNYVITLWFICFCFLLFFLIFSFFVR